MYGIVNLEDTTDVTFSGGITHNTKPTSTNILHYSLKIKRRKMERLKLHLFVDKIKCFMQLSIVRILLFGILQE